jgi:hypothetical protein
MVALSVVIILTTAPARVAAPQFRCHPIRPGDTAALLAQRLTGDPENRQRPWFRIVDPAAWSVIDKSDYQVIRPGWLACIAVGPSGPRSQWPANRATAAGVTPVGPPPRVQRQLEAIDLVVVGCWAAFCFLLTLILWSVAEGYLQETQSTLNRMRLFGGMFVKEFERGLAPSTCCERPIRSRLRYMPHRRRLDVLLAPDGGRHYPNLSDHKKNVEYDVARILHDLRHEAFVSGRLRTQGPWVVITFEFKPNSQTEGVL